MVGENQKLEVYDDDQVEPYVSFSKEERGGREGVREGGREGGKDGKGGKDGGREKTFSKDTRHHVRRESVREIER